MKDDERVDKLTGKVFSMTETEIDTIKTYQEQRNTIGVLINHATASLERTNRDMWRAVYDLHPELAGHDLAMNWEKKQILVRHELSDFEKQIQAEREA